MANWGQVGNQLTQGFEIGQKTGGKMSGVGQAIAKVADRLRSQRETGEAMKTQLDLLGQTEKIKAMYNPKGYEPKTQEEALAYEKAKAGIKNQPEAIVDKQGNVTGTRPAGSVFQPSASIDEVISALGTSGGLPSIKANMPKAIPTDTGNRVNVISPDGKRGSIPKEQLQEALSNGYKRTLK